MWSRNLKNEEAMARVGPQRHRKKNYHKCISVFMYSIRYSCQILMKLEFSRQNFRKILKYQISWKSVQYEPSCSMGTDRQTDCQTDRHYEADSRFSQFCERASQVLLIACGTFMYLSSKINHNFAADVYRCLQFLPWHALSSLNTMVFKTHL